MCGCVCVWVCVCGGGGVQGVGSWENRHGREVGGGVLKRYSAQYFAVEKKSKEKGAGGRSTRYTVACQGGRRFGPSIPSNRFFFKLHFQKIQSMANFWSKFYGDRTTKQPLLRRSKNIGMASEKLYRNTLNKQGESRFQQSVIDVFISLFITCYSHRLP